MENALLISLKVVVTALFLALFLSLILAWRVSNTHGKLEKILENFNNSLTELENMFNHNYRLYYDTGNLVFLKQYKNSQ